MIFIEGIELPIEARDFWPADGLEAASEMYPTFIKLGGTLYFHAFLIEIIKKVQNLNGPESEVSQKHFTEHLSAFIRKIGMEKFQAIANKYVPLRPKKKKGGRK